MPQYRSGLQLKGDVKDMVFFDQSSPDRNGE